MAFWRWTIALCIVLAFSFRSVIRERRSIAREWKTLAILGALGVGGFNTLVYVGLGSTTATNALLLNSAIPVLIALIGWLFMGQSVARAQWLGIAVSLAGVAAIIFKGDWTNLSALQLNAGDAWVFVAMIDWALYTLLLARRPKDISAGPFLASTMLAGLIAILPFYALEIAGGSRPELTLGAMVAIAYVGVFPSVLAYLFWNRAVAEVGGNRAGIFIHLMPVFGTLLSIAFLGERFHAYHAVGFALILLGITVTTRRTKPQSV